MNFSFATCDRARALQFLIKLYPSSEIVDSPDCAGKLLDLVESDIVRITDPEFHAGEVVPSRNWEESKREIVMDACAILTKASALKNRKYRYESVSCSSCGESFGCGDNGFSHCEHHAHLSPI